MARLAYLGDELVDADGLYWVIPDIIAVTADLSQTDALTVPTGGNTVVPAALSQQGTLEAPGSTLNLVAVAASLTQQGTLGAPTRDAVGDGLAMLAEFSPAIEMLVASTPGIEMLAAASPGVEMRAFAQVEA